MRAVTMELKQEHTNIRVNSKNEVVLDELYADICSVDSYTSSVTPPPPQVSSILAPRSTLPSWEFSPVPSIVSDSNLPTHHQRSSHRLEDIQRSSHRLEDIQRSSHRLEDVQRPSHRLEDIQRSSHRQEDVQRPSHRIEDLQRPSQRLEDIQRPSHRLEDLQRSSHRPEDIQRSSHHLEDIQNTSEYYNTCDQDNNNSPTVSTSSVQEWCPPSYNYHDYYSCYTTPNYSRSMYETSTDSSFQFMKPDIPYSNVQQYDLDFVRCSTPELITALASLQPEKPQFDSTDNNSTTTHKSQSASENYHPNVAVVQEHGTSAMFMHIAQRYQDSGYSSDLCMSPVYPYESKVPSSSNSDEKENVYVHEDMSYSQCSAPRLSVIKSKVSVTQTSTNQLPQIHIYCSSPQDQIQSNDISSSNYLSPVTSNQHTRAVHKMPAVLPSIPTNIVSLQHPMQKATEHAAAKRKMPVCTSPNSKDSKKQRHNQPLNIHATDTMQTWYEQNLDNPYPSKAEKEKLAREGGITITQVKSWFANKRNRNNNTRPKVQKRQMTEKLLDICHQLARDAKQPTMNNADIIQRLSSIITTPHADAEDV